MGQLIDGRWTTDRPPVDGPEGKFIRADASFRSHIGTADHPAEVGRYHLYLAHACPWCHRTAIVRQLEGLNDAITVSFVDPLMLEDGWTLPEGADPLHGANTIHALYTLADPTYSGRATVPLLWDKVSDTLVSNESSEIIRMFDTAFDPVLERPAIALYPEAGRPEIDAWNERIYHTVNNGVYRAGFAGTQAAYEEAFGELFDTLDALEAHLAGGRSYLVGETLTEADVRLWVTLVRFDVVYFGHFKCNLRRIADYEHLSRYMRRLFRIPAFGGTTQFAEIKQHYYASHRSLNPKGIVPLGPELDLEER